MKSEYAKCLVIEPNKRPYSTNINTNTRDINGIIDGYIEMIMPFNDKVCMIFNDEGRLRNLPLNRPIFYPDGKVRSIIVGTFIIIGYNGKEYVSLTKEQIDKYTEMFDEIPKYERNKDDIIIKTKGKIYNYQFNNQIRLYFFQ